MRNEKKVSISRRDFLKNSAVAGTGLALGAVGFPAVLRGAQPPEIPIGHLHPLSGSLAFDGQEMRKGLLLAVKEVNEAGGIKSLGGAKLKLLDADSEGKPELAISSMERLAKSGAVAVVGCYQSSVTLVATQQAEKLRIPFVVSVAVADEITARGFKYTFRIQPNSEQMASYTLKYLREIADAANTPIKTIAYLHDNTAFGQPLAAHVKQLAPKQGLELILDVPYSPAAPDVTTEVGAIKASGADIVLDTGYFGDGVRVYKTMKDLRLQAKAVLGLANGAFSHPKFVQELGSIAENVMDGNYHANPLSEITKRAFANYKKEFNADMGSGTIFPYMAVYVIADALERAKSTKGEQLREALAKTDLKNHILPQGPLVFGPDGQNVNAAPVIMQVQNGSVKVVWPVAYADGKPIFPVSM
jgi:branched-chain amino acid transport system substrate-binding protein